MAATLGFGALAQLVERLHGMQEVRGSTPLGSTTTPMQLHFSDLGRGTDHY